MELNEAVNLLTAHADSKSDFFCENKPAQTEATNWKSRINGYNSKGEACTGQRLYTNMEEYYATHEDSFGCFVEKPRAGFAWSVRASGKKCFPIQAHHLIPKNYLPSHPICAFLSIKYKKDPKYELEADTYYDTDHANNGVCLPYASCTSDWKKVRNDDAKQKVAFSMMMRTRRQLHQGSHRMDPYELPEGSMEEAGIHEDMPGYLKAIEKMLNVVYDGVSNHVNACKQCKQKNAGKKIKVRPLSRVVDHVDTVSGFIRKMLNYTFGPLFVSEYAYKFAQRAAKKRGA